MIRKRIITQNAELIRLRDGSVRCWIDVQDYQSGKARTGAICYAYKDGAFAAVPGVLTDTDGRRYGYVFDVLRRHGTLPATKETFRFRGIDAGCAAYPARRYSKEESDALRRELAAVGVTGI